MPYCGETSLVKTVGQKKTAIAVRCRSWGCADCAPQRKKQLVAEGRGGSPTIFLTLTSKRDTRRTAEGAAYELARAWRLLRLRIMRRYKMRRLPFICVFEATQLGWPHLHIMLRSSYIDGGWISEQMRNITGSHIIDIRRIDNPGRVAGYVAKYLSKGAAKFGTCKRYWQSQDYDLRPDPPAREPLPPGQGWERDTWSLHRLARAWTELQWRVRWISTREIEVDTC